MIDFSTWFWIDILMIINLLLDWLIDGGLLKVSSYEGFKKEEDVEKERFTFDSNGDDFIKISVKVSNFWGFFIYTFLSTFYSFDDLIKIVSNTRNFLIYLLSFLF